MSLVLRSEAIQCTGSTGQYFFTASIFSKNSCFRFMKKGFKLLEELSNVAIVHSLSNMKTQDLGLSLESTRPKARATLTAILETNTPADNSDLGVVKPRSGVTLAFAKTRLAEK